MQSRHLEIHHAHKIGWLRAAVLGANDGIISTASLLIGVAAARLPEAQILVTGVAGLVAGAMSMAAGEYVSVSVQSDTEHAEIAREKHELAFDIDHEYEELAAIYERRGLSPTLAREVAEQLMAKDALGAHLRDELGISEMLRARPIQAALTSALTFASGAALPLLATWLAPRPVLIETLAGSSLLSLALLGATAARSGGAPVLSGAARVTFWGAIAMTVTATIGELLHAVV